MIRRDKFIALIRVPAVRKLLITLIVASLAAAGVMIEPEMADNLITVAAAVGEVL